MTAISWPFRVNLAVTGSTAPRAMRILKAPSIEFCEGLSMKSKEAMSSIPMALRLRMVPDKLHLRISGSVLFTKES